MRAYELLRASQRRRGGIKNSYRAIKAASRIQARARTLHMPNVRVGVNKANLTEALELLTKRGLIKVETRDSVLGLQKLRNLSIHGTPGRVTSKEAREYVVMAEAAMWSLENNLKKSLGK